MKKKIEISLVALLGLLLVLTLVYVIFIKNKSSVPNEQPTVANQKNNMNTADNELKEKNYNPINFTLKSGQSQDIKGATVTLVSFKESEAEAVVQVSYKSQVWNFIMKESDSEIFGDMAIQLQYVNMSKKSKNASDHELTFSIFPKNDMLK
ncbi:MAG: hypothetical protein V4473_01915 [Patescibacteria group bacterium]